MDVPAAPKDLLVAMYRVMVRIRKFELKVNELFLRGLVPGTIHLSHGQEAVAAGTSACLRRSDRIAVGHRPHGHALAKGMSPQALFAEILGRSAGCTGGKGGSMHIVDMEHGILPSIPIVGAAIPIATGVAFASAYRDTGDVVVSVFGDGATNTGAFHEGLNLAAVWRLPVVFVCENNLYGVSTRIDRVSRLTDLSLRAGAYGIPGTTVDGNDVEAVHTAVREAVVRARAGEGPTLIECKTYRHGGHSRTDPATYRPKEEVAAWLRRDPLPRCREKIIQRQYLTSTACDALEQEEEALIQQAAQWAIDSPEPDPQTALSHVVA